MSSGKICKRQFFLNHLLVTKCGGLWAPIRGKRPVGSLSLLSMRTWKRLEVNEVSFGALGRGGWPMKYLGHVWWVVHGSGRNTLDIMKHVDSSFFGSWLGGPRRSIHGRRAVRDWQDQVDQVHDDTHDLSLNGGKLLHAWTDKKPMMLGVFMFGDPSGCWELLVKVCAPVCKIHVLGLWMLF